MPSFTYMNAGARGEGERGEGEGIRVKESGKGIG